MRIYFTFGIFRKSMGGVNGFSGTCVAFVVAVAATDAHSSICASSRFGGPLYLRRAPFRAAKSQTAFPIYAPASTGKTPDVLTVDLCDAPDCFRGIERLSYAYSKRCIVFESDAGGDVAAQLPDVVSAPRVPIPFDRRCKAFCCAATAAFRADKRSA